MLEVGFRSYLRKKGRSRNRLITAGRRLDVGLEPRPRIKKAAGAFDFIFKQQLGGIEVAHSGSALALFLSRNSALGATEPALKRWLERWVRGGGIALR